MSLTALPQDCLWLIFGRLRIQPEKPYYLDKRWTQLLRAYFREYFFYCPSTDSLLQTSSPYRLVCLSSAVFPAQWVPQRTIRSLHLDGVPGSSEPVDFSAWPSLKSLIAEHWSPAGLPPQLKELEVDTISLEVLLSVHSLKSLTVRTLGGDIDPLMSWTQLQDLSVSYYTGSLVGLSRLTQLSRLSLGQALAEDIQMEINCLTRLERLYYPGLTLKYLPSLHHLRTLQLCDNNLTLEAGYGGITRMTNLYSLRLFSRQPLINPHYLVPLVGLTQLHNLQIYNLKCANPIPVLSQITNLTLDVRGLRADFILKFPNVTWIDLTYTLNRSRHLASLLQLTHLQTVKITVHTDHQLDSLRSDPSLPLLQGQVTVLIYFRDRKITWEE